ncbi:MAG: hypothetical protein K0U98_06155 [Deltaproteobacteria bacterium]|nr:hypothetical protein [Deltaproteobacteria bacterium]
MSRQPAKRPAHRPLVVSSLELRDRVLALLYSPVHFQGGAPPVWREPMECDEHAKRYCHFVADYLSGSGPLATQLMNWLTASGSIPKVPGLASGLACVLGVRVSDLQLRTIPPNYVERLVERQRSEWAYLKQLGLEEPS